jgi:hypothetical protein
MKSMSRSCKIREDAGEIARAFDLRAAGGVQLRADGVGDEIGERGLAQAGRAAEQHVVQRLAAHLGGLDHDEELLLDLRLAVELGEIARAQGEIEGRVRFVERGVHAAGCRERRRRRKEWSKEAAEGRNDLMQPRALLFAALVSTTAFAAPPGATPVPAPAPPKSIAPHVPANWKAGTAVAKVTPQKMLWMAGYAARKKPAEGKVQELFAKALALQDEQGNKLVFVTLDLIGVPQLPCGMRWPSVRRRNSSCRRRTSS